jgi:hypothetical protein
VTRPAPHRTALALAVALVALATAPRPAMAQWRSVGLDGGRLQAEVRNAEGARIRIWVDDRRFLRATFRLPPGLARLDPAGCPTFQVDDRVAENLATEAHACSVEGVRSEVVLAQVSGTRVESPTLLDLMNGEQLTVRYRLQHAGYGASRFTLRGSKQALSDALGVGVRVAGD